MSLLGSKRKIFNLISTSHLPRISAVLAESLLLTSAVVVRFATSFAHPVDNLSSALTGDTTADFAHLGPPPWGKSLPSRRYRDVVLYLGNTWR